MLYVYSEYNVCGNAALLGPISFPEHKKNNRFPFLDISLSFVGGPDFRVFKEYPQKSEIWRCETSP